jgi:hypothetical protein
MLSSEDVVKLHSLSFSAYKGYKSWCSGPRFASMDTSQCGNDDGDGRVLLCVVSWCTFRGGFCAEWFHCLWKSLNLWCLLMFSSKSIFSWNTLVCRRLKHLCIAKFQYKSSYTNKEIPLSTIRNWWPIPSWKTPECPEASFCCPGKVTGHKSSVMAFFALQRIKRKSYLFLKLKCWSD